MYSKFINLFSLTTGIPEKTYDSTNLALIDSEPIKVVQKQFDDEANEFTITPEISDSKIERDNYIQKSSPKMYKVVEGDTLTKISTKFGVSIESIYAANPGFDKNTKLSIGQIINIPASRKIINVKNLSDVAKAIGLSESFIKQLKRSEDAPNTPDNKFHNTPYNDNVGVTTIGIGHAIQNKKDEQEIIKKYGDLNLTNAEVCELFASDLLEAEDNIIAIIGQNNYNDLPSSMKEALLDMVFNKGNAIIKETEGLAWCLKNGKYEAAINKFTNIKSTKSGQEMAGLAKRRLFDISIAIQMYDGQVPQSNVNTIQSLYNKGVELLRNECTTSGLDFSSQIVGFNKDIQQYFDGKVQLKYITE